ncbi:hypothetical protein P7K49_023868 [Saguinus oedipus]|uniref:Uncharacterized protein n=1 Tax=Saguinus oedipus TaxID=9490 RepID=A0ABQ9UMX0_SAGOE|nr:hypothetical protein P7K49_023868 [Saguinus oedipus]
MAESIGVTFAPVLLNSKTEEKQQHRSPQGISKENLSKLKNLPRDKAHFHVAKTPLLTLPVQKSHQSKVAVTFVFTPLKPRLQCVCYSGREEKQCSDMDRKVKGDAHLKTPPSTQESLVWENSFSGALNWDGKSEPHNMDCAKEDPPWSQVDGGRKTDCRSGDGGDSGPKCSTGRNKSEEAPACA